MVSRRVAGVVLASAFVTAASAAEQTALESLTVTAAPFSALDPGLEDVAESLAESPGGTNLILPGQQTRLGSLQDALDYQPGVLVQAFSGGNDQPRLSMRGSGIQSMPLSRGVLLRQDGLPLNDADGSFIIGLIEPRDSWAITAHRGANSRALGPATLGGDINFLSASGREQTLLARLEEGGYDRRGAQLALGAHHSRLDYRLSVSLDDYAGFRHHSRSERRSVRGNLGWRRGVFETRLTAGYTDLAFQLPFALDAKRAEASPRAVVGDDDPFWPAPRAGAVPLADIVGLLGGEATPQAALMESMLNVYRRDPRRASRQWRVASRSLLGDAGQAVQLGVYAQQTEDRFVDPLSHAVSDPRTLGAQLSWHRALGDWQVQLGLDAAQTVMDRQYFENNDGEAGDQYADLALDADHLIADLQWRWQFADHWNLNGQWQFGKAARNARDRQDDERLEQTWTYQTPKIGLIYQRRAQRYFLNVSESREVPSFWEIASNKIDPMPVSQPEVVLNALELQRGCSVEAGGGGRIGALLNWQLSLYRTELQDELLSTAGSSGLVDDTVNYAGKTRHQGAELGLSGAWAGASFGARYRVAWTFSDFRFRGGEYAGKRIAGVPRHLLQARGLLSWKGLELGPTVTWSAGKNPVDHSNTAYQHAYLLWGAQIDYRPSDSWRFYLLAENLSDEVYASAYVIRSQADTTLPTYFPGNGRSINGGLVYRF